MENPDEKPCAIDGCENTLKRSKQSRAQFAKRKFCSNACAAKGQKRPGRAQQRVCAKGLHDLTDEANIYRVPSTGRRRCKPCLRAAETARGPAAPRQRAPRKPKPAAKAAPPPPSGPPRPIWRPAGWSPQVNVWAGVRR